MTKCKHCGKITKAMYGMNSGTYCEDHAEAASIRQDLDDRLKNGLRLIYTK